MKFSLSQIRDSEEPPDPEEDDTTAEEYHKEMIYGKKNDYISFLHQAEKALRSAPPMTWDEFLEKWG